MPNTPDLHDIRVLNVAMLEAIDFVQAEGWDQPPTLFGLVPHFLVADAMGSSLDDDAHNPLALVVQEGIPENILPGSEELGEFIASIRWPEQVVGAILAQEITFVNSAEGASSEPRAARLISGVLNDNGSGAERAFIQLRPTEEELAADPFAQDNVDLLGGDEIAPGVITALRTTFEEDYED